MDLEKTAKGDPTRRGLELRFEGVVAASHPKLPRSLTNDDLLVRIGKPTADRIKDLISAELGLEVTQAEVTVSWGYPWLRKTATV